MNILALILSFVGLNNNVELSEFKSNDFYMKGLNNSETRTRVVIVDSGLAKSYLKAPYMCKDVALMSLMKDLKPSDPHGTNITGLIAKDINVDKYCITMVKIDINPGGAENIPLTLTKLSQAVSKIGVINMSLNYPAYSHEGAKALQQLVRRGVKIVVAAGNQSLNLDVACVIYPACYSKIIKHPNFKVIGALAEFSNVGSIVDLFLTGELVGTPPMRGTSMAAGIYSGMLVK